MLRRAMAFLFTVALLGGCAASAHADSSNDRVSFLNDIYVQQGEEVQDAVCFLCSIHVDGTLHGDAVAFLGSIRTQGKIEGDVVSFLGSVDLGSDASIGQDCVVFGGMLHRHGDASVGQDVVVFPFVLFLVPILFLVLIIYGIRALVLRSRVPYPLYPR